MTGKARRVWLTILKNTLNRPFSIVRHVGRKTGNPAAIVLKLLRRSEFRLLRAAARA